jgi:hypothetical protein
MAFDDEATRSGLTVGGAMPTKLETVGWHTWTIVVVLLIAVLAMVYLAY